MRVEHNFTLRAKCPLDKKPDIYTVIVRTGRMVKVEEILEAAKRIAEKPLFQEELTQLIYREIACEVETQGWHSGVFTKVVCS